jgi:uncharacterized membrane protein YfcA
MHLDLGLSLGGFLVGIIVGLTGMGGGALMTPMLILVFGASPSAAVSSDLVASLFMRPLGGAVHWKRGTVHRGIVTWLLVAAVPTAFLGAVIQHALGSGSTAENRIKIVLGVALLAAVVAMLARLLTSPRTPGDDGLDSPVRRVPTLLLGGIGGLIVGVTSVGAGSVIIVVMMWLYPRMSTRSLVGTDLVQAVPLVASAALGQLIFGDVKLGLTTSLLIGSMPGVFLGAQISARTTAGWLRPALSVVLLASSLKLLGVGTTATLLAALGLAVVVAVTLVVMSRRRPAAIPAAAVAARETSAAPVR